MCRPFFLYCFRSEQVTPVVRWCHGNLHEISATFYIPVNDLFILIIIMYIVAHKPQKEHNKQTYLQIITLQ